MTEFSLLELNRNKMRTIYLFIATLMFGHTVLAQSANDKKTAEVVSQVRLSQKYAVKMLEDYRENGKSKVEDLFAYFQMLTDASLTDDLKKEVVKNIKNSFQNQNPEVIDFTSETNDTIKLDSLIDKLLFSEPIVFKVSDAEQNNSETGLSWKTNYTITRVKSGVSQNIKVSQLVYLFEQNKVFGTSSKNVTVSFLGKME
ncbi:hypothetical protein GS03_01255 [Flavobacterium sangjuense]|uniref:Uncharacterized protein n=2 Tax=Flavobacterium sangjuense TaxID=2518177 RepID=A0A4P7PS83_9FLAO|nr:hypothetical protein GS03_01255 [Flavobacterium sangjuense]